MLLSKRAFAVPAGCFCLILIYREISRHTSYREIHVFFLKALYRGYPPSEVREIMPRERYGGYATALLCAHNDLYADF